MNLGHVTVGRVRAALAGLVLAGAVLGGCGSAATPKPADTYGGIPTFLPTPSIHPDAVLVGTATRPALTTEGDAVDARLASGTVRITVTGPEVPGQGLPVQTPATTCTWTVVMGGATAPVPIRAADFGTTDHLGTAYHPTFVPGQPRPPAVLAPGRTVTFELRAVMMTGEGLLRWSPGGRPVASWDFEVEND